MKDELIKAMREAVSRYTNVHHGKVIELCAEAALTLMSREWVKVEDRLPEDGMPVLFIAHKDVIIGTFYLTYGYWRVPEVFVETYRGSYTTAEVTYWQPLPTPPKQ